MLQDNECYRGNVTSTYNVIEAACKLGVRKIIIASSETTYEVCFGQGDLEYTAFPLDETFDVNPMDTYAISKLCGERVARGLARRFDADIYALRIGNVVEPHEYARDFPKYINNPMMRKRNAWSYIDARDLGQICDLCVKRDGLGFQVFNATNDTITATFPTRSFLEQYCPNTPITREVEVYSSQFDYVEGMQDCSNNNSELYSRHHVHLLHGYMPPGHVSGDCRSSTAR